MSIQIPNLHTSNRTLVTVREDATVFIQRRKDAAHAGPFAVKGSLTRGYATFNYGFTLLHLGRCKASLVPLQLALRIESKSQARFIRPEIKRARACAQGAASAPAP